MVDHKLVDSIKEQLEELNRLRREHKEIETNVARLVVENDMLRDSLAKAERARDFYQRHSMRLVSSLSDIGMLIEQRMQEAKDDAFAPTLPAVPVDPEKLEKAIEGIAKTAREEAMPIPAFVKRGPLAEDNKRRGIGTT